MHIQQINPQKFQTTDICNFQHHKSWLWICFALLSMPSQIWCQIKKALSYTNKIYFLSPWFLCLRPLHTTSIDIETVVRSKSTQILWHLWAKVHPMFIANLCAYWGHVIFRNFIDRFLTDILISASFILIW